MSIESRPPLMTGKKKKKWSQLSIDMGASFLNTSMKLTQTNGAVIVKPYTTRFQNFISNRILCLYKFFWLLYPTHIFVITFLNIFFHTFKPPVVYIYCVCMFVILLLLLGAQIKLFGGETMAQSLSEIRNQKINNI